MPRNRAYGAAVSRRKVCGQEFSRRWLNWNVVERGGKEGLGLPAIQHSPVRSPTADVRAETRWAMCGRLRAVKGSFTSQRWSEQPCVRPISAAHRAAGHNALRGSGPGQKLAFDDALAQVGCPDHRIDRFCITCCWPFPTVPSHRCRRDLVARRFAYRASARGSL